MTRNSRNTAAAGLPPYISVVVPVRNEARFLQRTLEELLTQDYPADRYEVLVADGQSTDATPALVRALEMRHDNLRLLPNPRCWSSAGRNQGIEAARGDLILVVDGHCELKNSHYLRDLADAFARSEADCVGRPQPLDVTGATPLQQAIAAARSCRLGHHPESFIYSSAERFVRPQSVAVAYRRDVFDRVGRFDEAFDACEDVEFNHRVDRAGLRCFFTPRVAVSYRPRTSLRGVFEQMIRYGRGRVRLFRKHPDTFTPAGFLPATFVMGLAVGLLPALLSPIVALAYAAIVGIYATVVMMTSFGLSIRARKPSLLPLLPMVFTAIHLGAGVGQLWEWVFGTSLPTKNPASRRRKQPEKAPVVARTLAVPTPAARLLDAA